MRRSPAMSPFLVVVLSHEREQLLQSQFFGIVSLLLSIAGTHPNLKISSYLVEVSLRDYTDRYRVILKACRHRCSSAMAGKTRSQIEFPS